MEPMTIDEAKSWMKLKSSDPAPKGYPEKWHEAHGFIAGWNARGKDVERIFKALVIALSLVKRQDDFVLNIKNYVEDIKPASFEEPEKTK